MTRAGWIVSAIVLGAIALALWALTGDADADAAGPTVEQIDQALRVRGIEAGRTFPYSIAGRFWELTSDVDIRVSGNRVTLEFSVTPFVSRIKPTVKH